MLTPSIFRQLLRAIPGPDSGAGSAAAAGYKIYFILSFCLHSADTGGFGEFGEYFAELCFLCLVTSV